MLVTLEEAKEYLRVDNDADDNLITGTIAAATGIALAYTGDPTIADLDPVPADLKHGILVGVAHLYDQAGNPKATDPRDVMWPFLSPYRAWAF